MVRSARLPDPALDSLCVFGMLAVIQGNISSLPGSDEGPCSTGQWEKQLEVTIQAVARSIRGTGTSNTDPHSNEGDRGGPDQRLPSQHQQLPTFNFHIWIPCSGDMQDALHRALGPSGVCVATEVQHLRSLHSLVGDPRPHDALCACLFE
jgi:hypothetical protein